MIWAPTQASTCASVSSVGGMFTLPGILAASAALAVSAALAALAAHTFKRFSLAFANLLALLVKKIVKPGDVIGGFANLF